MVCVWTVLFLSQNVTGHTCFLLPGSPCSPAQQTKPHADNIGGQARAYTAAQEQNQAFPRNCWLELSKLSETAFQESTFTRSWTALHGEHFRLPNY